jgi:adenylate cyclase class 2
MVGTMMGEAFVKNGLAGGNVLMLGGPLADNNVSLVESGFRSVMEENEVIVDDKEMARRIFTSLGLKLQESISKYRESYKIMDSLVEIDINDKSFCPFPYLEIETSSVEKLEEIVKLLGYTLEDTTSQTIYDILAERGIEGKTKGR